MSPFYIFYYDPATRDIIGTNIILDDQLGPQVEPFVIVPTVEIYNNRWAYRMKADLSDIELIPDFFVTYAEPAGNLTGHYESPYGTGPTQPNSIQVTRQVYDNWEQYRATSDRTGVRPILNDAQILAAYKPQIRMRMENNAKAAGFGSLADAIRWKDRTGSAYESHGQAWDNYEAAVWTYCTMERLHPEPDMSPFLADLDTNVPPPAAIPYPF